MRRIFVDTSAFVALEDRADASHTQALGYRDTIKAQRLPLITTNFVLDETYTWLRVNLGHQQAVDFGEAIQGSRVVEIIHVTPEIEQEAWRIFRRYKDKTFSFTDCTSFVVLNRLGITEAFAIDEHFAQVGFRQVP